MTLRNLKLGTDGDLTLTGSNLGTVSDYEAIRQACRSSLLFFKGEWFLLLDLGIPYYDSVLIKNPNPVLLQSLFRDALLSTAGVKALTSLTLELNRAARTLVVTFTASTDLGELTDSVTLPG